MFTKPVFTNVIEMCKEYETHHLDLILHEYPDKMWDCACNRVLYDDRYPVAFFMTNGMPCPVYREKYATAVKFRCWMDRDDFAKMITNQNTLSLTFTKWVV